jgi:hypothetical protein
MANSTTIQTLVDGPRNLVMKMTGILDTSNLIATEFVVPATTFKVTGSDGNNPPLVRLDHIDYSIADGLELIISWGNAAGPITPILPIAGRGRMSFVDFEGLRNNAAGTDGSIWVATTGYSSGTYVFSLVFEMVKEGLTYSGGAAR